MKTFSKCVATVLSVAGFIALAGCSKGPSSHKVATTANWNVRTSTSVEQNDYAFWQQNKEVATYSVAFTEGSNSSYKIVYNDLENAVYKTKFYLTTFDWATDATIEAYRTGESTTEYVYVCEMEYTVSGYFQIKPDGAKHEFTDELVTKCYYRPAGKNLQPVYSYQKVINTTPAKLSTNNINNAYMHIDKEFYTYYNKACTQATVKEIVHKSETDRTNVTESEKKIRLSGNSGHSNFDNSQIYAAVRAFTMSGGATRTFNVLAPENGAVQSVSARIGNPAELNAKDDSQIINALNNAPKNYIFFDGRPSDGTETAKNFRYNAVSLGINALMKGASSTVWYSTVENNDVNSTRCVLLKMNTILGFGTGTLTYTLKTLELE